MRNARSILIAVSAGLMIATQPLLGANNAPAGHASAPAASAAPAVHSAPAPVQSAPHSGGSSAVENAKGASASPTAQIASRTSGSNVQEHRHDFDRHYNAVYGDPWYGYNSGWNSGWYGNGYTNNGYYNDATYQPTYPDNSNAQSTTPAPTPSPQPSGGTQTAAGTEAQLENIVDRSPKMAAANSAVQSAQAAYDSAREQVLATLNTKPEYQQAMARRHQASSELATVKSTPSSMPTVVDAASAKLEAADEVTKIQEQAIASDPTASAAKEQLNQAVAARDGLRAQMLPVH